MPEIIINHDNTFDIAIGRSRQEVSWKNKEWLWSEFVKKLSDTHRTAESFLEYCAAKKSRQDEIKDVGGFVGGFLTSGRRTKSSVLHRQLITLDIDHGAPGMWEDFEMVYGNAAVCYSTHKHSPDHPRLRLILPLDREVGPDEYQAIARRIAGNLGIENFDHTTFEPSRLMYWPSTSRDGSYEFQYQDGPWICADEILSAYHNWRDSSEWPVSERYHTIIQNAIKKQGDPMEKPGVIGAFCRTYSIEEAIDVFLSDIYAPCDTEGRYTYREGSTTGGLVIYEDKYTFSHHGTDPTSMKLCNAFDLVRIHKFHLKDEDAREGTPGNKLPSFTAMSEFAHKDVKVRKQYGAERFAEAFADFDQDPDGEKEEGGQQAEPELPVEMDWVVKLDIDSKGSYYSTLDNVVIILENDPRLKGRIYLNEFDQREGVKGDLPWRKVTPATNYLTDRDVANLRHYLEKYYQISSAPKVEDALMVVLEKNKVHPIKEYLNSLEWDGIGRIENLLTEYLGVAPSEYVKAISRKVLTAAVSRIYKPGCKFDYVLTLIGKQGLKKSSLIDKLGGAWFSDSFTTMQGKEAYEQLQGAWLIEIAELAGMRKADMETIKHFITKRKDRYRVSYGRRVEEFLRQCIFFATTNDRTPLRDITGGRRFWPVDVHEIPPTKDVAIDLTQEVIDQIWAEAMQLYKNKELLYLTPELEEVAAGTQADHSEVDERIGMVQKYLDTLLPEKWSGMGLFERRAWLNGDELQPDGTEVRTKVCAVEIFCEVLGGRPQDVNKQSTKEIHDMMRNMDGWQPSKSKLSFGAYGVLRGYVLDEKTIASKRENAKKHCLKLCPEFD